MLIALGVGMFVAGCGSGEFPVLVLNESGREFVVGVDTGRERLVFGAPARAAVEQRIVGQHGYPTEVLVRDDECVVQAGVNWFGDPLKGFLVHVAPDGAVTVKSNDELDRLSRDNIRALTDRIGPPSDGSSGPSCPRFWLY